MLKRLVTEYLDARRALGFELYDPERALLAFADYAKARGESHVRAATVIEWAASGNTPGQRRRRLQCLVLFARYVRAEDARHEVPSKGLFPKVPRQLVPYIYSPEESRRLIEAVGTLGVPGSMRELTAETIIALLFATGLRVSEALALDIDDVTPTGLMVRRTKFNKTRLVPLHETSREGLERYLVRRRAVGRSTNALFLNYHGNRFGHRGFGATFRRICKAAGVERPPGEQQPRVHDIRHTFAVRALEACPDGRDRVAQHMLALTTYLGHTHVADTYWYLQATPRLMRDIADRVRDALGQRGAR
jgi:site-specific recombinase XerD